jgi:DNA-directed RNA polymerase subunit K/omega
VNYSREQLAEKAGGYFALAALINKRKKELATGMPPFVNIDSDNYDDIISEEIMQGKIKLKRADFSPETDIEMGNPEHI